MGIILMVPTDIAMSIPMGYSSYSYPSAISSMGLDVPFVSDGNRIASVLWDKTLIVSDTVQFSGSALTLAQMIRL